MPEHGYMVSPRELAIYDACKSLAQWLASMDEPGNESRRTVTLAEIVESAKDALALRKRESADA